MKSMSGMSSKLKQKAVQRFKSLGQTAVVSLLALLLAIGPAAPAFAQGETADQATGSGGLMSTIAVIFNAAGSFARGEYAAGRPIPERDLSSALAALNEFNLAVLKDPRLAGILDEIIAELLEGEGVAAGIQNNTEFIAAVVRDPRLVDTLGEIISDYLQDERLTADFEYLFSVIFELIAEEDLHYYIRDTLAALVEHESLEQTINDLLLTAVNIIYNAGTDAIVALVTDERIPQVIKELASLFIEPFPQIITLLLVDEDNERILQVAEEMLLILAEYGTGLPVNIMEDERLKAALADLILMVYEPVPEAAGAIASDLSEHLFHKTAQGLTADNTLEDALDNFVQDFFKSGLQSYLENSLTTLISQARARAQSATPSDRSLMGQQANIQKSIADGVAKVPPQMVKFGFVRWLVDGNPSPAYSQTPGLDPVPRTYRLWARDVGGLLKENQRAASLAGAAANSIRSILDDYIAENQGHLANLIREAVEGLPL
ncbi:MAG TPA: hypothetical protein PLZ49_10310, partial [Bacillota bacterium]|nr:hypothetical protein [Bacillota bacterium]